MCATSIIENIAYGMGQSGLPEATDAMVLAACALNTDLAQLPGGDGTRR